MLVALRVLALLAAVLMLVLASGSNLGIGHADGWTRAEVLARLETATPLAACIVRVETGGTYEPYSVGAQGELGPVQLHPRGLLPTFYARGYSDPYSPDESITFLESELAAGRGAAWSTYWRCR